METLTQQIVTKKRGNPNWLPGVSGNPGGRVANPEKRQLQNALREAAKNNGNREFLHHVADLAYKDKGVTLAVLNKLVADATLPKENESNGFRQLVIIRADAGEQKAQAVPRPVHLQPEAVSGDVVELGHRQDDVIDISGHAIQRADPE